MSLIMIDPFQTWFIHVNFRNNFLVVNQQVTMENHHQIDGQAMEVAMGHVFQLANC